MAKEKKKFVQVRLSVPLVADAGVVASALDLSTPQFIEQCVREGIKKHASQARLRLDRLAKGQEPE